MRWVMGRSPGPRPRGDRSATAASTNSRDGMYGAFEGEVVLR